MLRLVELIGAESINLFTPDLSLIHYLLLNIYFVKPSCCSRRSVGCQNQTDLLIPIWVLFV